ncbi:uncharacterized protein LOC129589482 [Paramacrobiotus metropolitanus]|uniref:uncharacterized protein LOC129589482 n=1 Tax=Paramacrobiotus metropolitanus TaxID=2943436 RepID=UPI002445CC77|nr:uncharacterized protein LOC129589482 [Paramacrobiotus metropolitanus]
MPMSSGQLEPSMATNPEDIAVVVEVRGGDRAKQCGKVVAVSSSGLRVDFRCTGRRNEWVPLDQALFYWANISAYSYSGRRRSRFYGDQGIADPVEVLMQRSPSEPWTWQPAGVLVYDRQHGQFAWVAIFLPGGFIRTVVPRNRIRRPASMVSLANGLLETMEARRMENFSLENHLFYNKSVLRPVESAAPTSGKQQERQNGYRAKEKWWTAFLPCGGRSPSPARVVVVPAPVLNEDSVIRFLTVEILTEILQSLPTVDQCRLWTVCSGWNRVLTSAALRNLLHIQFPSTSDEIRPGSVYIAVACAHRCWSTRTVAIVGSPVRDDCKEKLRLNHLPLCDGLFLRALINGAVEKFPQDLVLKDINCEYILKDNDVDYIITLHRVFDQLAAVCHTLTVKNFTCQIFKSVADGRMPITIHIPFGRMRSDRRLRMADWWGLIGRGCPRLDEEEKDEVGFVINNTPQHFARLRELLEKIVRARQTNDPRRKVTYLKPAPAAGQYPLRWVDVDRLTRMTQYLLYCAITNTPFNCIMTWD